MSEATILVIEDELQIRRFVRTALEGEGLRVVDADTRRLGLQEAALDGLLLLLGRGLHAGLLVFEILDLLGLGVGGQNGDLLLQLLRLVLQRLLLAGDLVLGLIAETFDLAGHVLAHLGEAQDRRPVDDENFWLHGRRRVGGQRGHRGRDHKRGGEKKFFHGLRTLFQRRNE